MAPSPSKVGFSAAAIILVLAACAAGFPTAARDNCTDSGVRPAFAPQPDAGLPNLLARQRPTAPAAIVQPFHPPTGLAFFRSQSASGSSRLCVYDRSGSPYVLTIGAIDICPLSLP